MQITSEPLPVRGLDPGDVHERRVRKGIDIGAVRDWPASEARARVHRGLF